MLLLLMPLKQMLGHLQWSLLCYLGHFVLREGPRMRQASGLPACVRRARQTDFSSPRITQKLDASRGGQPMFAERLLFTGMQRKLH